MKFRRLTHTFLVLASIAPLSHAAVAQNTAGVSPATAAPTAPPPAPAPPTVAPAPAQATPMSHNQLPSMPPAPPTSLSPEHSEMPPSPPAPIDVNSPGIEAVLPATIKVSGVAALINGKPLTFQTLVQKFLAAGAPQFLDEMINEQLIRQQAASEGVVVTKAETDAKMIDAKRYILPQYPGMDWAQFLSLQGRSESYVRSNIYDGLLAVKLVEKSMPQASLQGKVHLFHILKLTTQVPNGPQPVTDAAAKAEIQEIYDQIKAGKETFQEAAMRESQDSTASKGGDLGWVAPNANLDPNFSRAAFALKEGEISEPVKSQYGWHLIYAAKFGVHATPADIAAYESSEDDRARAQIQPYLKHLRATAKVVNYVLPAPTTLSPMVHIVRPTTVPPGKTSKKKVK